ncbi:hypothetical protein OPIT5_11055 [Opitutaceae bacterium TAV5]|nr:hypothetical protein OPIT5_11055 [Opitutaceae bacterium TAV5]
MTTLLFTLPFFDYGASAELAALTLREHDVPGHLARGLVGKQAGDRPGISEQTVRVHIRNLHARLPVHSRTEAVLRYPGR